MTVYAIDAERCVIGGAIVSPSLLSDLLRVVEPGDFYHAGHQELFNAIERRHVVGDVVDASVIKTDVSLTDAHDVIADCIASFGSSQSAMTHAKTVAEYAAIRRVQAIASSTLSAVDEGVRDVTVLLDDLESNIATISVPSDPRPVEGLWRASALLDAEFQQPPWVAPGFLREGWRLLIVGAEGGGKSTMLRQIVAGCAVGQHPFTFAPMDPVPGLIIDVENPESVIRDGLARMPETVKDSELSILARPGGLDIRQRRDRDLLHRVFAEVQPKVVTIGPLYKLYRIGKRESDEQAAIEAQNVLDDLRVTYGCAMILETHAPKGSGPIRDLIPFGSSAWMRWPELGWKLVPCDMQGQIVKNGQSVKVDRFRGDRVEVHAPEWFDRATLWPWAPYWPNGVPKEHAA